MRLFSGKKIKRQLGPESSQKTLKRTLRKTAFQCVARLAQSVERKALNLVVAGLSPMVGVVELQ